MISNHYDFILFIGGIHGIIFNVITLTYASRKKITRPILYLNLVVLGISLTNIQAWAFTKDITLYGFVLNYLELPWYVFSVPALYCFLLYFLQLKHNSSSILRNLLVVFLVEIIFRLGVISYCYYTDYTTDLIERYRQIEESINAVIALFYLYKSYRIVFKRKEEYAFVLSFDTLVWLRNFMRLGGVVFLFWLLAIVLNFYYNNIVAYYPLRIGTTVLIYWIGYQGLIRYTVLKDRIQLRNKIRQNYTKPNAFDEQQTANHVALQTVENYIVTEQLFLNPQLGIQDVAQALSMSVSKLSKLINAHSQSHFSDLINKLRVEHAMKLLQNKDFDSYTINAIGLESGFNSKTAFYTAFKKIYSHTPSAYRHSTTT